MDNWVGITAAVAVPVATFLFALYQWIVKSEEKRNQEREERWREHTEQEERRHQHHEKRWEEHAKTFLRHEERIGKNERDMSTTRDELHRDYVREDALKEMRQELREDISKLFQKLSGMSRDLNRAIGELKGRKGDNE